MLSPRLMRIGTAMVLAGALLACKQSEKAEPPAAAAPAVADGTQGAACKGDGDCKNGLLCESGACLPADRVQLLRSAAAASATAAATAAATTTATAKPDDLTGVGGRSKVPTTAEWNSVGEITVRHSGPLGCETKMVREWFRSSCRTGPGAHQILDVKVRSTSGMAKGEVFTLVRSGVASVVLPVRPGTKAELEYVWNDWGKRTLTVHFPSGAPKPTFEFDASAPK